SNLMVRRLLHQRSCKDRSARRPHLRYSIYWHNGPSARSEMMRHYLHGAVRLLLFSLLLALARCGGEAPPAIQDPAFERPSGLDARGLGDPNAPIVLVEYSDYQCEFCASFVRDTKPQLEESYIKTGKVYFVYRDYPLAIHPGAKLAAWAANCAADQGSFWPMHDRLYNGAMGGE